MPAIFLLPLSFLRFPFKEGCQDRGPKAKIESSAGVVELVDAGDSKSPGPRACASSSLASGTSKFEGLGFKILNPFFYEQVGE